MQLFKEVLPAIDKRIAQIEVEVAKIRNEIAELQGNPYNQSERDLEDRLYILEVMGAELDSDIRHLKTWKDQLSACRNVDDFVRLLEG